MDDLLTQIGQRIRKHRERSRLSQEQLAERADVSSQTISTAETGKKRLRVENIIKICEVLEISPDYLLLGEISPQDLIILSEKLSQLTPGQYRHLEDIIDSYISALSEKQ
jgi:transcriptional regulator with XRE-family HTH domain